MTKWVFRHVAGTRPVLFSGQVEALLYFQWTLETLLHAYFDFLSALCHA